jgi:UDP-glucose 4-epimerase
MKDIKLTTNEQYVKDNAGELVSVSIEEKKNLESVLERTKQNRVLSFGISSSYTENTRIDLL